MTTPLWLVALLLSDVCCMGQVVDADRQRDESSALRPGPQPGPAAEAAENPGAPAAAAAPVLRRLNRTEYDNTVRDLLGDTSRPAAATFPTDSAALGFDNNGAALTVPPLLAERLVLAAEALARNAVAKLGTLLPCAAMADDACAARFVGDFGLRAWRRPLTADEVTRLLAIYRSGRQAGDFKTGIDLVLRSLLVAPDFLFRVETGDPPTPWELASRLSYFLWQSMPDEPLFAAARSGTLSAPGQLATQAERLLADPRAKKAVVRFHEQWLRLQPLAEDGHLPKDRKIFPAWKTELAPVMHREMSAFIEDVFWKSPSPLEGLLLAEHGFANKELAAHYGIVGPVGSALERVPLGERRRAGVLARAGLLATLAHHNQSSPTLRGVFVREQLLCETLPPPPPSVNNTPSEPNAKQTTRERLSQHASDATCAGCHRLIDPIGLAFENFDGTGQWRDVESAKPIDASGEIVGGVGLEGRFTGVPDLARRLASSPQVRACVVRQWMRFAHGRAEAQEDGPLVAQLAQGLRDSGGDLRRTLVDLVGTPAFLSRRGGAR